MTLSRRRMLLAAVVGLVVLAAAVVSSFPARAIVEQRREVAAARDRLAALDGAVERLSARAEHLHDPAEIERLARADYDLVRPGWESYRLLSPSTHDVPLPDGWPILADRGR